MLQALFSLCDIQIRRISFFCAVVVTVSILECMEKLVLYMFARKKREMGQGNDWEVFFPEIKWHLKQRKRRSGYFIDSPCESVILANPRPGFLATDLFALLYD